MSTKMKCEQKKVWKKVVKKPLRWACLCPSPFLSITTNGCHLVGSRGSSSRTELDDPFTGKSWNTKPATQVRFRYEIVDEQEESLRQLR